MGAGTKGGGALQDSDVLKLASKHAPTRPFPSFRPGEHGSEGSAAPTSSTNPARGPGLVHLELQAPEADLGAAAQVSDELCSAVASAFERAADETGTAQAVLPAYLDRVAVRAPPRAEGQGDLVAVAARMLLAPDAVAAVARMQPGGQPQEQLRVRLVLGAVYSGSGSVVGGQAVWDSEEVLRLMPPDGHAGPSTAEGPAAELPIVLPVSPGHPQERSLISRGVPLPHSKQCASPSLRVGQFVLPRRPASRAVGVPAAGR